ncbi:MAG TPA: recombinase family protein [Phycisphaerales bacterium]
MRLISGEPGAVEVVRSIYRRYFSDKVGYWTIAKDLNDRGVPSPTGKGWSLSTVKAIIDNPTYSGRGVANRSTMALYYARATDQPAEAPKARRTASGRPAQTMRPSSEWIVVEYPELAEFLPPDLRMLAAEHHLRILDDLKSGRERAARDKHHGSDFLLKGILKTVDGKPTTGRRKGRHGESRYYAVSKSFSNPTSERVARRMVPAEPLEATALYLAKCLILSMPGLRDQIAAEYKAAVRRRAGDGQDRDALATEVRRLDRRIAVALDEFDGEDEPAVRAKLAELKAARREAAERLRAMATPAALSDSDVEKFVDAVIAVQVEQAEALRELSAAHLRELLTTFIESMTVDLATMKVEMVARIPLWASGSAAKASEAMGLDCTSVYKAVAEAHPLAGAERRLWFVVPPQRLRRRAA